MEGQEKGKKPKGRGCTVNMPSILCPLNCNHQSTNLINLIFTGVIYPSFKYVL